MAKNTLEKLDEEIEQNIKVASTDLSTLHQSVQGTWGIAIREAQDRLRGLVTEYKKTLLANSMAIVLEGSVDKTFEFVAFVVEQGGMAVNALALYERLASQVEPSLGNPPVWATHQSWLLSVALQDVMKDLGIDEILAPGKTPDMAVPTHQDVLQLIQQLLAAGPSTLGTLYVLHEVFLQARAIRYTGLMAPVFVYNTTEPLVGFGKGVRRVILEKTDKIDETFLTKTLKSLKK